MEILLLQVHLKCLEGVIMILSALLLEVSGAILTLVYTLRFIYFC
jgi:hypothetical protein